MTRADELNELGGIRDEARAAHDYSETWCKRGEIGHVVLSGGARVRRSRDDVVVRLSNEAPTVVLGLDAAAPPTLRSGSAAYLLLGVAGCRVVAFADPHGGWLRWLDTNE